MSADFGVFGRKYENDPRVIFDQWPMLSLGLDVRPEISILKSIYILLNYLGQTFPDDSGSPDRSQYQSQPGGQKRKRIQQMESDSD